MLSAFAQYCQSVLTFGLQISLQFRTQQPCWLGCRLSVLLIRLFLFVPVFLFHSSHRSKKGISPAVMSKGEEMGSQRRDGVDGRPTGRRRTDRETETATETETDAGNGTHSPPRKLKDSSTMSVGGKTGSSGKRTKSRISEAQTTLPLKKRNRTLGCRGR